MGALKIIHKSRKSYNCSRCDGRIKKGEMYYKIAHKFRTPIKICKKHRCPRPSELTTSDKVSRYLGVGESIYDAMEKFKKREMSLDDLVAEVETGVGELEEVSEEYEESASNMEEYFEGSPKVDEIREKAEEVDAWRDVLESAKDTLESLELPDEDKLSDIDFIEQMNQYFTDKEDAIEELDSALNESP